jgi:hypothetical protein
MNTVRKLETGYFRLYSRKKDAKTVKVRNLETFNTREVAEKALLGVSATKPQLVVDTHQKNTVY